MQGIRKPTAQQIADGDPSKRGKRKLQEALEKEPTPNRGYPACPRHLKGRARSMWNFLAEEIAHMNLDHRPDAAALEGACVAYAKAVTADILVEKEGIIRKNRRHPALDVSFTAWTQVRHFCTEFGLTPASRTRIHVDKVQKKPPELERVLTAPRGPHLVEQPAEKPTVQ